MCVHVSTRIRVQYVCNYIHTCVATCMYVCVLHVCTLSQFSNLDLRFLDEKIPQSTCSGPEAPHGAT